MVGANDYSPPFFIISTKKFVVEDIFLSGIFL